MSRTEPPAEDTDILRRGERILTGIAVSPGIAIGAVHLAHEPKMDVRRGSIAAAGVAGEIARLDAAVQVSRKQLAKLKARLAAMPEDGQQELAPLLDAYIQMLGPGRLLRQAKARIERELVTAETAVLDEMEVLAKAMIGRPPERGREPPAARPGHETRHSPDETEGAASRDSADIPIGSVGRPGKESRISAETRDEAEARQRRADEIRETGRRLLRNLTESPFRSIAGISQGAILVAEALRPADAALIDPARIAGLATEEGGADGHTAIMLRALGVPAVLGLPGVLAAVRSGMPAVLDGATGRIILNPRQTTIAEARQGIAAHARERRRLARLRRLPAETIDHERVELQGNLELLAELPLIAQSGAAGIGLFRTEFLFMNRDTLPDEMAQAAIYRTVLEAMDGDSVTIRVLDWGGEKDIDALSARGLVPHSLDPNPALGVRGLRLLLRQPALLEAQLGAILRASRHGPVRVLLPMVTNTSEVRAAREIYERVARRLRRRGEKLGDQLPPLGVMIETPGAALSADALALEADFFAIGTNDLAMYTLAVDRGAADVADLYDPLHPAVLRLIQFATEAALRMRMPVSVCGEMAANPKLTPLLLGLGLRAFSMNAAAVPRVKQAVRSVSIDSCARFARRVMEQSDPERIGDLVAKFAT